MSFNLQESVAPFCQGRWNGYRYVPTSSSEVIQCCLKSCQEHPNYCFDLCDQTYKTDPHDRKICYQQCNELALDCTDACYSLPSEGINIVGKCAKLAGCGEKPNFSTACLQDKKDEIVQCCQTECTGDQSLDCDNRCDVLHQLLVNGTTRIQRELPEHKETEAEYKTDPTHRKEVTLLVILIILFVLVIARIV